MKKLIALTIGIVFLGLAGVAAIVIVLSSDLPQLITVEDYEPLLVSEVYDRNGHKIGEFFREKRILTPYEEFPEVLIQAFLAAEDSTFFQHGGINYVSIFRAFMANLKAGRRVQGGSTITQQVARSLLLSSEKTYTRKIKEAILAYRMEANLTKEEILYLYLNQIFLGQGAYGVAAAADIYFRKPVGELTVAESALLAGLPQAPSLYNPISNSARAKERQRYVLNRMADEGFISREETDELLVTPLPVYVRKNYREIAPYYLELIRQMLVRQLGETMVLDKGIKIYTGLDLAKQLEAQEQVQKGLRELDKRQGYRGALKNITETEDVAKFLLETRNRLMTEASQLRIIQADGSMMERGPLNLTGKDEDGNALPTLPDYIELDQTVEAIVTKVDDKWGLVHVRFAESKGLIDLETMTWARQPDPNIRFNLAEIKKPSEALKMGDVILVRVSGRSFTSNRIQRELNQLRQQQGNRFTRPDALPDFEQYAALELEQEPIAEAALISLDQETQDVIAMVGGYDFSRSEFNRTIQAARQTGSSFKSLVYAAALDHSYTPATAIIDAPLVYEEEVDEGPDSEETTTRTWRPLNHSKRFGGDILFRNALIRSLNVPTVKIIEDIGVNWVATYSRRLGIFSPLNMDFTLALGSSGVTVYELTRAFSIFGRLGKRTSPLIIHRVENAQGEILLENITLDHRFESELKAIEENFEEKRLAYLTKKTALLDPNSLDPNHFESTRQPASEEEAQYIPTEASNSDEKNGLNGKVTKSRPEPLIYFEDPDQLIRPSTAYVTTTLLQAAVEEPGGTGRAARAVGRPVAGKTGSTNGYYDAWFIGYTADIATGVWVGFDNEQPLGFGEVGGRAALPIWVNYMKASHEGLPVRNFPTPEGIVFANIDNETGKLASASSQNVVRQAFIEGTEPQEISNDPASRAYQDFFKEDLSE